MTVLVAPPGTDPMDRAAWTEIGTAESVTSTQEEETYHSWWDPNSLRRVTGPKSFTIQLDDGRTIYAPAAKIKYLSPNNVEILLDTTYSFPQRYVLGIDQEKSPLAIDSANSRETVYKNGIGRNVVLSTNGFHPQIDIPSKSQTVVTSEDVPDFAYELFNKSAKLPKALVNLPASAQPFISVGTGESQARVYTPKNEEQARRNLNFAIANLKAYQQWEKVTKPALERQKEADLKRMEAEKKAKEEAKKREIEEERAKRTNAGLALYNKVNGTRYITWSSMPFTVSLSTRENWADQAEEIENLKRKTDPFRIQPGVITADHLFGNGGYINARRFGL